MTEWLLELVPHYGTWLVAVVTFLSCLALPVPSSILMLAAGGFAASGDLMLWQVAGAALAGALLGDQIGYAAGRQGGPPLVARLSARPQRAALLERARAMMLRRGFAAIWRPREWGGKLRAVRCDRQGVDPRGGAADGHGCGDAGQVGGGRAPAFAHRVRAGRRRRIGGGAAPQAGENRRCPAGAVIRFGAHPGRRPWDREGWSRRHGARFRSGRPVAGQGHLRWVHHRARGHLNGHRPGDHAVRPARARAWVRRDRVGQVRNRVAGRLARCARGGQRDGRVCPDRRRIVVGVIRLRRIIGGLRMIRRACHIWGRGRGLPPGFAQLHENLLEIRTFERWPWGRRGGQDGVGQNGGQHDEPRSFGFLRSTSRWLPLLYRHRRC